MPYQQPRVLHLVLDLATANFKGTQRLTCAVCGETFVPNKDDQMFTTTLSNYRDAEHYQRCKQATEVTYES